ncbi:nodulation protein NodH [Celeribacter litoreus]|uniref:nodulation protein NodH n=1 Tax=Celeribacter litoreus TaxID=2876714 RepID=UPI001CCE8A3F|nr:nodulation protein NodH [Celeribacter litoreus]MCA0042084.1 nodulation protein NodH [Celeribacter litoreus]
MQRPFDSFVIFAEMRTGSNFLEENVNSYPGLTCWGEAFNPAFVGKSKKQEMLGVTMAMREENPLQLLARMKEETEGLSGFRFFHNHDPRVLKTVLDDRRCAKIILTRNPLESYVSRKIAAETGQWRLSDLKDARSAQVTFDRSEFQSMLDETKAFQLDLQRALQRSGQTAFYINYDDIQDVEVINGLARYLGVTEEHAKTTKKTKVQNPKRLRDKVLNYDEMVADLANIDFFNLSNTPNFEPRRGPAVPSYVACAKSPLLFMPVQSGPHAAIEAWMAAMDGAATKDLTREFTQKTLRQWKRKNKGHRCFTVISHPVVRLHRAFCAHILPTGPQAFGEIRELLRVTYKLPLPVGPIDESYSLEQHREAFLKFAAFVEGNLNGQTSVRTDANWASQSEVIKGFADFALPDMILREETLADDLSRLSDSIARPSARIGTMAGDTPFALQDIYDSEVESAVRAAYQRDYMMLGFKPWR